MSNADEKHGKILGVSLEAGPRQSLQAFAVSVQF